MEDPTCSLQLMNNLPYDETVVVKDSEEVPSVYFPAPHQTVLVNMSTQQKDHMTKNNNYVQEKDPLYKVKDPHRPSLLEPNKSNEEVEEEEEDEEEDDDSHDDNSDDDDDDDDDVNDVPNDEEEEKEDDDNDDDDDDVPNDEEEEEDDDDDGEKEDDDDDSDEMESKDERSFEQLSISSSVEELFNFITGYNPQTIELNYKLIPFIPDFIPAVGDTDAFLKVPRPDGKADGLGLLVLDEPFPKQSDPTMLSMWFSENSKQHNVTMKVKSVENPQKNQKDIKNWIESIGELHRSKPAATVHYTCPMPDIEDLMQEWPPEFEELLGKINLPPAYINCDVAEYLELICAILDIPVFENRIQSLHVLLTLYSEFKNSQHFKAKEEKETG